MALACAANYAAEVIAELRERPVSDPNDLSGKKIRWDNGWIQLFAADGQFTTRRVLSHVLGTLVIGLKPPPSASLPVGRCYSRFACFFLTRV
jgi:hypothetical protein